MAMIVAVMLLSSRCAAFEFQVYQHSQSVSAVQYSVNVDANERSRNAPVRLRSETRYGRTLRFFELNLPSSFPLTAPRTLLLALIARIKPTKLDPHLGTPICQGDTLETPVIVDVSSLEDLIGRVRNRGLCSLIQRSGNSVQVGGESECFVDDEGQ